MKKTIEIIRELKQGNDLLYKKLYVENRSIFFKYANRYDIPDEDVKDIYQDTFLVFINKIQSGEIVKINSKISTYIIGIGHNKIFERLRENKKGQRLTNQLYNKTEKVYDIQHTKDETNDKYVQMLYEHLKQISCKCRDVILDFYYKRLTIDEICKKGNYANANVVKSHKSRCLKKLRETIQNEMK